MSAEAEQRVDPDPEYLDVAGVADRTGLRESSIKGALAKGGMPEPDLVWYGVDLWLPSTIDDWRRVGSKRGPRRPAPTPRAEKIRTEPTKAGRPPRLAGPKQAGRKPGRAPNAKLAPHGPGRDVVAPKVTVVAEPIARQIAEALRADGYWCTTEDVLELAGARAQEGRERELLRQRVEAKRRGLRAREL